MSTLTTNYLGDQISYPIGLLLIKWIEYYYPLISDEHFIPQKHGDNPGRSIAFRNEFMDLISYYPGSKDASAFLYDLKKGITRQDLHEATSKLIRKLRTTIIKQPMHYIGSAIGRGSIDPGIQWSVCFGERGSGRLVFPHRGYKFDSMSAMIVAKNNDWTPDSILERGLTMLEFLCSYIGHDFNEIQEEDKYKILGLHFMFKANPVK